MKTEPILVWRYDDAPEELKVSANGGDEDWLAMVPLSADERCISWLENGTPFGVCAVQMYGHPHRKDATIYIGVHA